MRAWQRLDTTGGVAYRERYACVPKLLAAISHAARRQRGDAVCCCRRKAHHERIAPRFGSKGSVGAVRSLSSSGLSLITAYIAYTAPTHPLLLQCTVKHGTPRSTLNTNDPACIITEALQIYPSCLPTGPRRHHRPTVVYRQPGGHGSEFVERKACPGNERKPRTDLVALNRPRFDRVHF